MNTSTIARLLLITAIAITTPDSAQAQTTPPASATSSFLPLSHDEALALAAAENKPLLLVFTGDWSADSRALLSETLATPQAAALLRERTVALSLNVVENPLLTEKHRVKNVPAMVLLSPEGSFLRRWDGFVSPHRFTRDLSNELTGKTALAKLRRSLLPRSPSGRLKRARKLHAAGYSDAALEELHWLLENPLAQDWHVGSFHHFSYPEVLNEIARIRPSDLLTLRDKERAATLADPSSSAHARRYSFLCTRLGDTQPVLDLYRALPAGRARDQLHREIFPMLVQRRDYADAVATLKDVDHALSMAARFREPDLKSRVVLRIFSPTGRAIRKLQLRAVTGRSIFFEAYAGAQRVTEARTIATAILAWDRLGSSPAVLRAAARDALGSDADAFLTALDLPALYPPIPPSK